MKIKINAIIATLIIILSSTIILTPDIAKADTTETGTFWIDQEPGNGHDGGKFENNNENRWSKDTQITHDDFDDTARIINWANSNGIYSSRRRDQDLNDGTSEEGAWCIAAAEEGGMWGPEDSRGYATFWTNLIKISDYVDTTQTDFEITSATLYCDYRMWSNDFDDNRDYIYLNMYIVDITEQGDPVCFDFQKHSGNGDAPNNIGGNYPGDGYCTDYWDPGDGDTNPDDPAIDNYQVSNLYNTGTLANYFNNRINHEFQIYFHIDIRLYGENWDPEKFKFRIDDFGVKCDYSYTMPNEKPNPPTLDSPNNGATFTIEQGQTKDITLKATATDPENNQIKYRFYDADTEDVIGTTNWKNSGEQGSIIWDNLPIGTYNWYAKASDNEGYGDASTTYSFTIEEQIINNPPDTPDKPSGPSEGETGEILTYTTSATDPEGDILTYRFDWGDETTSNWGNPTQTKTYNTEGTYTIKAQAKDEHGEKSQWSNGKTVTIQNEDEPPENQPPGKPNMIDAIYNAEILTLYTYMTSAVDPDGDEVNFLWDWDGDDIVDEISPMVNSGFLHIMNHMFLTEGLYQVKVKAVDINGNEGPWSDTCDVIAFSQNENPNNPNIPEKPTGPTTGETGDKYTFSTTSTDPDKNNISYLWDMDGDDKLDYITLQYPNGEVCFQDHKYLETGSFQIRVRAYDQHFGYSDWSEPLNIVISKGKDDPPIKPLKPGLGPSKGYLNQELTYNAVSYDPEGSEIKFGWDWDGDDNVDEWSNYYEDEISDTRSHSWSIPGTYEIKVLAKDKQGLTSQWSEKRQIIILDSKEGSIFVPQDGDFGEPKIIQDIFWMRDNKDDVNKTVNKTTGAVGAFASATACLPLIDYLIGTTDIEVYHNLTFDVGRAKHLKFDVEMILTHAVDTSLGSIATNWLVWRYGRWNNYHEKELSKTFLGLDDLGSIWGILTVDVIHNMMKTSEGVATLVRILVGGGSVTMPIPPTKPWLLLLKLHDLAKAIPSGIVFILYLVVESVLWYNTYLDYVNLNAHYMDLEKEGAAEIKHITFEKDYQPGRHTIWAGLRSKSHAYGVGGANAYCAGQITSIRVHGLSPPEIKTLTGTDQAFVGENFNLNIKAIDYNEDPIKYHIDWGDGTTTTTDFYDSQEQVTEKHKYTQSGTYTITVKAEDCDKMLSETDTYTIEIIKDTTSPTLDITRPLRGIYFYDQQVISSVPSKPFIIGEITVKADAYDEGMKQVIFKKDSVTFEIDTTPQYSGTCYLPSNGFKNVDFKAIAEDHSGNQEIDYIEALYFNKGKQTMTTTQPLGSKPEKTKTIIIPQPPGSTETELKQGIKDLRQTLNDEYNGATITYTYQIDYGDGSPVETIEKEYPILHITHEYQENESHTITITLSITLKINGQTYVHIETYEMESESSKEKVMKFQIIQRLFAKFPMLARFFEKLHFFTE